MQGFQNSLMHIFFKFKYFIYNKLLFLRQQVKGGDSFLLNALCSEAKELLQEALGTSKIQNLNAIKKLTNLKLECNGTPFEFTSGFVDL